MTLKIYTDGGSKGNPGPAAIGVVGFINGKEVMSFRADIGRATNNEAEYRAVCEALKELKNSGIISKPGVSAIEVYSDSRLMVNQLNGFYKVKNAKIREYIMKIRILEQEISLPIKYHYIPRHQNTKADGLVNNKSVQMRASK